MKPRHFLSLFLLPCLLATIGSSQVNLNELLLRIDQAPATLSPELEASLQSSPGQTLEIVDTLLSAYPEWFCEIIKVSILTRPEQFTDIVRTAVLLMPERTQQILECILRSLEGADLSVFGFTREELPILLDSIAAAPTPPGGQGEAPGGTETGGPTGGPSGPGVLFPEQNIDNSVVSPSGG